MPDRIYIQLYHRLRVGRKINFKNPRTLNEKLQWLKFNYRFPLQTIVSDKLLVREYVKKKIGEEYLIPLIGFWKRFSDIDFKKLPNQFVLKCNHDSGGLVVCTNKRELDISKVRKKIEKSLKSNFFYIGREYQYTMELYYHYNSIALYFVYFAMLGISNYANRLIAKNANNINKLNDIFSGIYYFQLITSSIVISSLLFQWDILSQLRRSTV